MTQRNSGTHRNSAIIEWFTSKERMEWKGEDGVCGFHPLRTVQPFSTSTLRHPGNSVNLLIQSFIAAHLLPCGWGLDLECSIRAWWPADGLLEGDLSREGSNLFGWLVCG